MIKLAVAKTQSFFYLQCLQIVLIGAVLLMLQPRGLYPFLASSIFILVNISLLVIVVHMFTNLNKAGKHKGLLVFLGLFKYIFLGAGLYLLMKFFKADIAWILLGLSTMVVTLILTSLTRIFFDRSI